MAIFFDPLAPAPEEATGLLGRVQFDRSAAPAAPLGTGGAVQFNRPPPSIAGQAPQSGFSAGTVGLPEGFYTEDNGTGTHNIFSPTGELVGTGYDDLNTTLLERQREHLLGSISETPSIPQALMRYMDGYEYGENAEWDINKVPSYLRPHVDERIAALPVQYHSPYFGETRQRETGRYETGDEGNPIYEDYIDPRRFDTREELEAEIAKLYATPELLDQVYGPSSWDEITPGTPFLGNANKWEALGIMLADEEAGGADPYKPLSLWGSEKGRTPISSQIFGLPGTGRLNSAGTDRVETITGEHALYGSQPVFDDGKLVGYQMDTRLFTPEQVQGIQAYNDAKAAEGGPYQTILEASPYGASHQWNRRSSATGVSLGREYLPGWENVATAGDGDGKLFVPLDKAAEVPGFKNLANTQYENWAGGGFLESVLPAIAMTAIMGPVGAKLGAAIGGGIGGVAASAVGKAAIGGALMGGVSSAIFGGDLLKGMLGGALGAGIGTYAAGSYLGAQGVNPALMTASPQLMAQANLVGSLAGNAAGDLVMGRSPTDRYSTTGGQLGLARHLFAI